MTILEEWRNKAYADDINSQKGQMFWAAYFAQEKEVYEDILSHPETPVKGTVKELAEKYNMKVVTFAGFLDGIDESLKVQNPIDTMDENTEVSLEFDIEKLYYNMCECKADWLYNLPQWDSLLTKERRHEIFLEQRKSGTVVRAEKKVGRNDPCPCGSGKKYKQCCGR